ncbi:MAG TPA: hypothetical protein VJ969_07330, partial [Desulfopila sp.]|nr:hypothetical protein [Desulfopila sp.]
MTNIRDQFREERLKTIRELEREQKVLPVEMWGFNLSVINRSDLALSTKKAYRRALKALQKTGINPFDFDALVEYAADLKPTHRTDLKQALRLLCMEFEQSAKQIATPENLSVVQALILRLDAMPGKVKVKAESNSQERIWLSPSQVQEITGLCGNTLEGKRDWIILALLLGAGLRRSELIKITFDALGKERTKTGIRRDVLQVTGHGGKDRTIPISPLL